MVLSSIQKTPPSHESWPRTLFRITSPTLYSLRVPGPMALGPWAPGPKGQSAQRAHRPMAQGPSAQRAPWDPLGRPPWDPTGPKNAYLGPLGPKNNYFLKYFVALFFND